MNTKKNHSVAENGVSDNSLPSSESGEPLSLIRNWKIIQINFCAENEFLKYKGI